MSSRVRGVLPFLLDSILSALTFKVEDWVKDQGMGLRSGLGSV